MNLKDPKPQDPPSPAARPVARFFAPIDIASLVYFRIAFGVLMAVEVWRYWVGYRLSSVLLAPQFQFKYFGFEWVEAPSPQGMQALFGILFLSAAGIALGFFYRVCAVTFAVGFTWWFLIDAAQYLNHFYLICLMSLLSIVLPAHHRWSLDSSRNPSLRSDVAPAWTLWLLRFQTAVVYVYGGIAKFNVDWLRGEPIRSWLVGRAEGSSIESLLRSEWTVGVICYGGLLFDLLIVPLLLWRKTRLLAFATATVFHLTNHWLFDIGVFPWLALALTALFFPPTWPRRLAGGLRSVPANESKKETPVWIRRAPSGPQYEKWIPAFLIIYCTWQILMPLRHWFYPGAVSWTEEGHRFSWHMKLRAKTGQTQFFLLDPATREVWALDPLAYLTPRQKQKMDGHPDMILQFAHYIAGLMGKKGRTNLHLHVIAKAELNGRRPALLIDPNVNLAAVDRRLGAAPWILPLENTHPGPSWLVPAPTSTGRAQLKNE